MKTHIIAVAAVAIASFALSACGTTSAQVDNALTNAQLVFTAAKSTVDADAQAGIIDAATAKKVDAYISAGDLALSGAIAAVAAHDATTEQAKLQAVLTAASEINAAVLTAVAAYAAK